MKARAIVVVMLCLAGTSFAAGCASASRSTRVTVDDDEAIATEIAVNLHDNFLVDRTPESPPMRIAITKVQNLTTDVIPQDRLWRLMARVRDAQSIVDLARERNARFTLPSATLRAALEADEELATLDFGSERAPTHRLSAVFRSMRRSTGEFRTDSYQCEFTLTELSNGHLAWQHSFEFKRQARGKIYD